jgi:hypothetical protein
MIVDLLPFAMISQQHAKPHSRKSKHGLKAQSLPRRYYMLKPQRKHKNKTKEGVSKGHPLVFATVYNLLSTVKKKGDASPFQKPQV